MLRVELLYLQSKLEIRTRIPASPSINVPTCLQEPDFHLLAQVQESGRCTAIKPLWEGEQRLRAPILASRRAPDGNVHRLLFDNLCNPQDQQKSPAGERTQI
jgi:hypothetical protein